MNIITTDKMLRELNIITTIFKAQYRKKDRYLPPLLDGDGANSIEGRFVCWSTILSDLELFNLQAFKDEITKRFESTTTHQLLISQLTEVYNSATKASEFYLKKLTRKNKLVKDFRDIIHLTYDERQQKHEYHSADVHVWNLRVQEIYFGTKYERKISSKYNFIYPTTNDNLFIFLDSLINFIKQLKIIDQEKAMEDNPLEEFSRIDTGFDWFEKTFIGIVLAYSHTYMRGEEFERFAEYCFGKSCTIVEQAFWEFTDEIEAGKIFNEDGSTSTMKDLNLYLEEYHRGFCFGYHNKFNKLIEDTTTIFKDKTSVSNKIFDIIRKDFNRHQGLSTTRIAPNYKKKILKKDLLFSNGMGVGLRYRAWYYICANPGNFEFQFKNDPYVIDFYKCALQYFEANDKSFTKEITELIIEFEGQDRNIEATASKLQSSTKQATVKNAPKRLFYAEVDYQKYLNVLKEVKKPIINEKGHFILGAKSKSKGSIVAWYDILRQKDLVDIKTMYLKDHVKVINTLIPNLDIDIRSFGNTSRSHTSYYPDLLALINKI